MRRQLNTGQFDLQLRFNSGVLVIQDQIWCFNLSRQIVRLLVSWVFIFEFHEVTAVTFDSPTPIFKEHFGAQINRADQNKTVDVYGDNKA
jgi:hypothetical protein